MRSMPSATISMQEFCTEKTLDLIEAWGQETVAFNHPIGVEAHGSLPDGSFSADGQADSRRDHARSAAGWSMPSPIPARISMARSLRSTAIPT